MTQIFNYPHKILSGLAPCRPESLLGFAAARAFFARTRLLFIGQAEIDFAPVQVDLVHCDAHRGTNRELAAPVHVELGLDPLHRRLPLPLTGHV